MVPLIEVKGCSTCDIRLYEGCLFYQTGATCVNDRTPTGELEEADQLC